jgi:hypothetical protein
MKSWEGCYDSGEDNPLEKWSPYVFSGGRWEVPYRFSRAPGFMGEDIWIRMEESERDRERKIAGLVP